MLLARLAPIALVAGLAGCPFDREAPPCEVAAGTLIELVVATGAGELRVVSDGTEVPLIGAPQGGQILLAGARLQMSTGGCQVQVNAALRDPGNNRVVGLEQRPLILEPSHDGWAAPREPAELSDLANVAVCPSAAASKDLHGNPFQLEVKLLDAGEAILAEGQAMVIPRCADAYCEQECAAVSRVASSAALLD